MIRREDFLFSPYLYLYEPDLFRLHNCIWVRRAELVGDIMCLFLSSAHKLDRTKYNIENFDGVDIIKYKIDKTVFDKYTSGQYSLIYTKKELNKWRTEIEGQGYWLKRIKLVYNILTKDESLIDMLERKLGLPRGLLERFELYDVTIYCDRRFNILR